MSIHRYPSAAAVADLARAGLGGTLAGVPLLLLPLGMGVTLVLIALLTIFACYAAAGFGRWVASVTADSDGISMVAPWRQRRVAWNRLRSLRLTYHSTSGDGERGWMTLSLVADDRISFDSRIDGFTEIVAQARAAAMRRHLCFDAPTLSNLHALGFGLPQPGTAGR